MIGRFLSFAAAARRRGCGPDRGGPTCRQNDYRAIFPRVASLDFVPTVRLIGDPMTLRPPRTVVLVLILFLVGSSASPGRSAAAATPPLPAPAATARTPVPVKPAVGAIWKLKQLPLEKGMAAADVRRLLGEPDTIKTGSSAQGKGEVWIYRHPVDIVTREFPDGTRPVSRFDPMNGKMVIEDEIVYRQELHQVFDTVILLLIEDRLTEWRRTSQVAKESLN